MKKRIIILIGAVLVIAIVGVALYANTMAARGVERGSERALGVDTSVGGVDLGLFSGSFGMSSLKVRNPKGFESDHFLALQDTDLSVDLWSVLADTVVVDRLTLDGIEMNLEMRNRDSNFGAILDNLRTFQSAGRAGRGEKGNKRLVIEELVITDVVARLNVTSPELGIAKEAVIEVPDIRLAGVGRRNGGVAVSEIASIVVTRVLDAVMRSENLPAQVRMMMQNEVGYLLDGQESLVAGVKMSGREEIDKAAQSSIDKAKEKVNDIVDN